MVIVFASILFALPTSLVVCLTRGLNLLQGSSLVLVALVAIPFGASTVVLLVQALRVPPRHMRRPATDLLAAPAAMELPRPGFVPRRARLFEQVEG